MTKVILILLAGLVFEAIGFLKPGNGLGRERAAAPEIAARNQFAIRMRGKPGPASSEELLDLVLVDEIVLLKIENGDEHIKVIEKIGEAAFGFQPECHIGARPPFGPGLIQGDGCRLDFIT